MTWLLSALLVSAIFVAAAIQSAPTDIVAEDLRDALYHLGTINGEITTTETLINIFSHFCIGK